jgi:hypothetical protein
MDARLPGRFITRVAVGSATPATVATDDTDSATGDAGADTVRVASGDVAGVGGGRRAGRDVRTSVSRALAACAKSAR